MKAMKLVNIELRREVESLRKLTGDEQKQLSSKIETIQKSTVHLETKVAELAIPKENDGLGALKTAINNRIAKVEVEFRSARSHFDKTMNKKTADINELTSQVEAIDEKVGDLKE